MTRRLPLLALFLASTIMTLPLAAQTWPSNEHTNSTLAGFGGALVIDGDEIIASRTGVSTMFPEPATQIGGVHIFARQDEGWTERRLLEASQGTFEDGFGQAMALAGDVLAVAASNTDDGRGAVYLFERSASSDWQETARLTASDAADGDRFGAAVAVHGDALLVGAPGRDEGRGTVYLFKKDPASMAWTQFTTMEGSRADAGHDFGAGLAFSGERALVGAPGYGDNKGAVYALRYDPAADAWTEEGVLMASDSTKSFFGLEMALDGERAVIAAPGMRLGGTMLNFRPKPGGAYVFHRDAGGAWAETSTLVPKDATGTMGVSPAIGYGIALAFNDDEIWVGAPFANRFTGTVHVYKPDGDAMAWSLSEVVSTAGVLPSAAGFGTRLAVQGDLAAVTIYRVDFGDGRAAVFERDAAGTWQEQTAIADAGLGLTAITGEEVRCTEGEAGPFNCSQVDLLSFLPVDAVGGGRGVIVNDIWGWTDPETAREIAVVGRSDGVSFVEVTNAHQPVFLGELPHTEGSTPNAWRDVKVYANHAFVVADNVGKHGMQIFDLTQLLDVTEPPVTFSETAIYDKIFSAHNLVVNEQTGFIYIVAASGGGETCGGGYHMVDVRDPKNPQFAGCYNDPSAGAGGTHVHDAQCVVYSGPDQDHQGKEICFGSNAAVLSITDMTDKENPTTLAAMGYPNVSYVHQGWLTEDQRYFYLDDELDEVSGVVDGTRTIIWDVSDLDDPLVINEFIGPTQASDHNLYIKGNVMYQANYVGGLQLFNISDPANPRQIGHFDTVPWGANAPGFAGAWSSYPFFESGTIIVTSIREGLFLLKKRDEVVP